MPKSDEEEGPAGGGRQPSKLIQLATKAAVARNARKARDAIAMIARKVDQIVEAFYDIALQLQVLQRMEIYSALGAKSVEEAVEKHTASEPPRSTSCASPSTFARDGGEARLRALARPHPAHGGDAETDSEEIARRNAEVGGGMLAQSATAIREKGRAVRRVEGEAATRRGGSALRSERAWAAREEDEG
jgi:hypothetical protein